MPNFQVDFYKKADGSIPVKEFLDSLDVKMRAKLLREVSLLEIAGNTLREPHSKPLGDGIFEIRAQQGSDISRVLYFFVIGKTVILTNGFIKKTQKTPPNEIATALKYRDDYLKRKGNKP